MPVEATSRHARRDTTILLTTLAAAQVFMSLAETLPNDSPAVEKYYSELVANDKCLDQTAYDPTLGANLTENADEQGNTILSVEPVSSAADLPVLQLFFQEQTLEGTTTYFTPADEASTAVLQNYCA